MDPLLNNFPRDLFDLKQRREGALLVHVIAFIYVVGLLIVVSHAYLMGALRRLAEKLKVEEGVAVSTLFSAGTSTPALFVSLVGTFVTKEDTGTTAVTSACVFNMFFTLAVCGLAIKPFVKVHWYSIWRDNVMFLVISTCLLWVTHDGYIVRIEAVFLLVCYCIFCLILHFNKRVERGMRRIVEKYRTGEGADTDDWPESERIPIIRYTVAPHRNPKKNIGRFRVIHAQAIPEEGQEEPNFEKDPNRVKRTNSLIPEDGAEDGSMISGYTSDPGKVFYPEFYTDGYCSYGYTSDPGFRSYGGQSGYAADVSHLHRPLKDRPPGSFYFSTDIDNYMKGPESPFIPPKSWFNKVFWVFSIPPVCVFYITIPDCRRPTWKKWWPLTILMCLIWICLLSYIMVWVSAIIADTADIPESTMALTLLAAGMSSANMVSSILLSHKEGKNAVMAVCNTVGSNLFNIGIGLGFPWLIKSLASHQVVLYNHTLVFAHISFIILAMFPLVAQAAGWKLNWKTSLFYFFIYSVFISVFLLMQLNIIGKYNVFVCKL